MYKEYLRVDKSKNGLGVFANIDIPKNSPLIEINGNIYRDLLGLVDENYLQIGHNTFLGKSGGVDDYLNHSCEPNAFISALGDRAILYSMYDIRANSEITFDYSTTSTDTLDTWKMNCNCGSFKCREIISGLQYLPSRKIEDYKSKGVIPLYMYTNYFINHSNFSDSLKELAKYETWAVDLGIAIKNFIRSHEIKNLSNVISNRLYGEESSSNALNQLTDIALETIKKNSK